MTQNLMINIVSPKTIKISLQVNELIERESIDDIYVPRGIANDFFRDKYKIYKKITCKNFSNEIHKK